MDRDKIKMGLWVISVIHALMQAVVHGKNSYILMSPRIVRPGRNLTIEGELLENPSEPVIISAELSNNGGPIASSRVTLNGKSKIQLDIPVPNHINFDSELFKRKELNLKISGSGGLSFTNAKTLSYNAKSSSVFIQTDKAIYKPGQPVQFRVFGVTPELKVIFDKLHF
ncbi:CD109 antigen-like [Ruditapes philippinarum]|uniref:CD109 antigen-like n=1 Tax=Ruditapes philippinarum TaxID=129788 RepID=UPI00295B2F54|nr:CD109 antigen-like [Ruditapes philippinarum]